MEARKWMQPLWPNTVNINSHCHSSSPWVTWSFWTTSQLSFPLRPILLPLPPFYSCQFWEYPLINIQTKLWKTQPGAGSFCSYVTLCILWTISLMVLYDSITGLDLLRATYIPDWLSFPNCPPSVWTLSVSIPNLIISCIPSFLPLSPFLSLHWWVDHHSLIFPNRNPQDLRYYC